MKCIKVMLAVAAMGAMFASCTKTSQTAVVVPDIQSRVHQHPLVADLKPVGGRAEITLKTSQLRKAEGNLEEYAVAELLKQKGGDVLLEKRVAKKRRGPFRRLVSLTVSGVPASYVNFHNSTREDHETFINPGAFQNGGCCKGRK